MNLLDTLSLALDTLQYHTEQTRPIDKTEKAITNLRLATAELEKAEPVACVNCGGTCEQFFCDTYKDKFDYQSHPAPAVPEEQWITELRYELMKSKMTHNFTFSRNEVIALLNAAPKGTP